MARKLEVVIVGDASQLNKTLENTGKSFSKFGKAAAVGIGAGLGLAAVGMKKAVDAASNLEESQNAVRVVFGKSAKTIENFSKKAAREAGLSMRELNELVTPLGAAFTNMGDSQKVAADKSVTLAKRAADMASVFNVDVKDALGAIQAGLRGEADPLERFGVGLSDAAVKAKAMEMGLADVEKELTGSDKAQARYALLMEQTDKVAGDFKNTSKGLANQKRILRAELENISAAIGEKLLPKVTEIVTWIGDNWPRAVKKIEEIWVKVKPTVMDMKDSIEDLIGWLRDHWPEIKQAISNFWGKVKPLLIAFRDLVKELAEKVKEHWQTIIASFEEAERKVPASLDTMTISMRTTTALMESDWKTAWDGIKTHTKSSLVRVGELLSIWNPKLNAQNREIGANMRGAIRDAFASVVGDVGAVLSRIGQKIAEYDERAKNWGRGIGKAILQGVWAGILFVKDWLEQKITGLFHSAIRWVKDALGIKSPSSVFHNIGVNMIKGMVNGIGSMRGFLKEAVIKLAKSVGSAALGGGASQRGGIQRILGEQSGLTPQVIRALNYARQHGWGGQVTSGFRSYAEQAALYRRYLDGGPLAAPPGRSSHERGHAVDVTDYGTFGRIMRGAPPDSRLYNRLGAIDPVHFSLTGYAKGGIFKRPTLGVIGEAGPEAVIPLSRGGGRPMQVNLQVDGRTLASVIVDPLRNELRQLQRAGGAV